MSSDANTPCQFDDVDLLDSLQITRIQDRERAGVGGKWVIGTIAGHEFQALVFPEQPEEASYAIDDSRISKLWLLEQATTDVAANFDRGWDVRPTTERAKRIVDLLAAGLAELVYRR